jgi:copper homeostasis protein
MTYTFEVAVDSLESALIAQDCGVHRIELCAALGIGGITPSHAMIALAKDRLDIPFNVIIRPRRGDFLYTDTEFEIMRGDIEYAKSQGANGVVLGLLLADGRIDVERTRELIELARPLEVTFHRAFDMVVDPHQALDDLISLEVDTLLTSGQLPTAEHGISLIAELVKRAEGRIKIMPGSGINPHNIKTIVDGSGATEFHFSGKKAVNSPMQYHNSGLSMGGKDVGSEYQRSYADADTIRAIIANAQNKE